MGDFDSVYEKVPIKTRSTTTSRIDACICWLHLKTEGNLLKKDKLMTA
jgi:hypothetical protein